jgi:hypothetical protein
MGTQHILWSLRVHAQTADANNIVAFSVFAEFSQ